MDYKHVFKPDQSGFTPVTQLGKSGLSKICFGIMSLKAGESAVFDTEETETVFHILGGTALFSTADRELGKIGKRNDVFSGKAAAVYLPRRTKVTVKALSFFESAVCQTPVDEDTEIAVVQPEEVQSMVLGFEGCKRITDFVIYTNVAAKSIFVGETWCKPANWAGFPPHKHDEDNLPFEEVAEELYFFRFQPEQGFAVQCLYTRDHELDNAYIVRNNELVEFPKGYHPIVSAPGYNTWFLWVTTSKAKRFCRTDDPDHAWINALANQDKWSRL